MIEEDIHETREAIRFIEEKMRFLRNKIEKAGGIEVAAGKIPKAWERFCLGPQLLSEKQILLNALEHELRDNVPS